jgi:hypothetical protein
MSKEITSQLELEHGLSVDSVVAAARDQIYCNLDGEAVILNLSNGVYYGLDDIAARVWSLIQEPRPVSDIVETLLAEYQVDRARCECELLTLLWKLFSEKLISIDEPTA